MSRPELQQPKCTEAAKKKMEGFKSDILDEVRGALVAHKIVVVGMGLNPHVKRARKALDDVGATHHYLGYGSYTGGWKERLAIKMWSGWPTFPQVFVDGHLVGGANEIEALIANDGLN